MLHLLFLVAAFKEVVVLDQHRYETALNGERVVLNVTSLTGEPIDVRLYANGEVRKYRSTSVVAKGEYEWMVVESDKANEIRVKWKRAPLSLTEMYMDYVAVAVIVLRVLSIFKIPHTQMLFQLVCLALALMIAGTGKQSERLIHLWSAK